MKTDTATSTVPIPVMPVSEHERAVQDHYNTMTKGFYLQWNPDHIHLGAFEPGECPRHNEQMKDATGLARALERMIELVVAPVGIEERHHVVDAGCGVGGTAIHLAKTRGCKVTGVNLSRLHLEMAENKAAATGMEDLVNFSYADCSRSLPFADHSVDVVVNIESARHYSDRGRFLREVCRILKPGGKIVASDWMARNNLRPNQYDKFIQPLCAAWAMHNLESQSTYTRLLHKNGLEVLEFEGFDGKELDNLQIIMNTYQSLRLLRHSGMRAPALLKLMDRIEKLYNAWRNSYFDIRRYCAVKT